MAILISNINLDVAAIDFNRMHQKKNILWYSAFVHFDVYKKKLSKTRA